MCAGMRKYLQVVARTVYDITMIYNIVVVSIHTFAEQQLDVVCPVVHQVSLVNCMSMFAIAESVGCALAIYIYMTHHTPRCKCLRIVVAPFAT